LTNYNVYSLETSVLPNETDEPELVNSGYDSDSSMEEEVVTRRKPSMIAPDLVDPIPVEGIISKSLPLFVPVSNQPNIMKGFLTLHYIIYCVIYINIFINIYLTLTSTETFTLPSTTF